MTRFITTLLLVGACVGCGQKGPLTLPEADTNAAQTQQSQATQAKPEQTESAKN
ncbi:LPS translocon maturation chaperone LptM [Ferrimonas aestuarii]|uniref:LPS translocon maturation chaperone LptM n=1 Tax=Ferrimonas aestuarii TaxID=2569539 RepID=UPI00145DE039|nr:lipoprotein [Ferrimonas aestuarii]